MLTMKNANLLSEEEALINMLKGTRYFYNNIEMFWDKKLSLFMCIGINKSPYQLVSHLRHYKEFKIKCDWWKIISPNGQLCWVRKRYEPAYIIKVWAFDGTYARDINGSDYPIQYLTPLTEEELKEFITNIS